MKAQHPVMYEHIGKALTFLAIFGFILIPAMLFWKRWFDHLNKVVAPPDVQMVQLPPQWTGEVKSVVCYNEKGDGPMEHCPAKIECHNEANTNSANSLIPCPFWPKGTQP